MRSWLAVAVLIAVAAASYAGEPSGPPLSGEAEFRAGWLAVVAPAQKPEGKPSRQARQEALQAALPHFEAAVRAAPDNSSYRTALCHAYLSAGKYQQAKEALDVAIERDRKNPLLYLFRAQAETALAYTKPEISIKDIEKAVRSFDDAAALDPENSLALVQAASVLFDAKQIEPAVGKTEAALGRPAITLYRLPIPGDPDPSKTTSTKMWQYAQLWQWAEMLARGQNAARMLVKLGQEKEKAGDLDAAEATFTQALKLGRLVGSARPNLFISANIGLNLMEDAYVNLLRVAQARKSPDAERWHGELGIVSIGRQELFAALQGYNRRIEEDPPNTVEELLDFEAASVAWAMGGTGLSPTHQPLVLEKRRQKAGPGSEASQSTPQEKPPATAPGA